MRKLIIILFVITLASCSQKKTFVKKNPKALELYKQYALCNCIFQSIKKLSVVDTSETYGGTAWNEIDAANVLDYKLDPMLDSLIFSEVIKSQIAARADTTTQDRAEGSAKKTDYTYSCLMFYKSKKLDSALKSFIKKRKTEK